MTLHHATAGLIRPSFFVPPILLVLLAGSLPATQAAGVPPEIPVDLLFRPALLSAVNVSPAGDAVAGITRDDPDISSLLLIDLAKKEGVTIRGSKTFMIGSPHWLGDRHVLYRVTRDKIFIEGLYLADRDNPKKQQLVNYNNNAEFVGAPRARPGHAIIWVYHARGDLLEDKDLLEIDSSSAVKVSFGEVRNLNTNVRSYPEPKGGTVLGYGSDADGELATCILYDARRKQALLYDRGSNAWRKLSLSSEKTSILLVEPDHTHLWICQYAEGEGYQVQRMEVVTGKREPPVVTDRVFDPGDGVAFYSHLEGKLAGICYDQRRRRNVWLLPKYAEAQAAIDRQLPDSDNSLINCDEREQKFLFRTVSDRYPGGYFLFDTVAHLLTPVGPAQPWLKDQPFRPMLPIHYTARDGLSLEGYLTLPAGADASHRVPLIVLCHGGPRSRDTWSFDPEVQFLASRGYAVLQPNFRGSSGYAPAVSLTPRFDYRRMHDDVTDATKAFSRLEMIDPDRVAIMGASFGGYLAVAGLAFEPGRYRCAVTLAGVFDWESVIKDAKWEGLPGEYEIYRDGLGKVGADKEAFRKISPLAAADEITAPVFIAHGLDDNVVDIAQSRKLAAALRHRKVPVETFYRDFELHGFYSYASQMEYYQAVETFLAKYLRAPTPPSPASSSRPSASN